MFFPDSGTWGTNYQPVLYHFFKADGTRLCDGSSEVQYTRGHSPEPNKPVCGTCREFREQRRAVYGAANAGTTGRSEHWPPLQGPAF